MNSVYSYAIIIILLFIIFISGCDDTGPIDTDIPDKDVSYSQHIQPILNVKCATSGCHDDATSAAGYSMTSWTNINRIPLVIPGESEVSHIVMVLTGQGGLLIMPPPSSPIAPVTDRELNGIKTWIDEGAKNN